jgi:arylformamidase
MEPFNFGMLVFRDYDQQALELQYDTGARSPEIAALRDARVKRTEEASTHVRATAQCQLDLRYGDHPRETFDLFLSGASRAPLLIFVHGGYWRMRSKTEFSYLAPPYLARGINFAVLNYPLCPEVRLSSVVSSCRRALLHIARQARSLDTDAGSIHLAGHSAGAHLAAMMMATDWGTLGAPRCLLKSVTAVSGLYDLAPLKLVKVNADLRLDDREVATLSPVRLEPKIRVPLTLTVGDAEAEEFRRQTEELAAAWGRLVPVDIMPAPGFYHFNILDEFAQPGRPLFERVASLVRSRCKEEANDERV